MIKKILHKMNYYYFIFWNVLKCIQLNVLEMNHVFVCHGSLFSSRRYLEKQNYYFSPKTHHPPSLKRKNYTQLQNLPSPSPMFQLHFLKKLKKSPTFIVLLVVNLVFLFLFYWRSLQFGSWRPFSHFFSFIVLFWIEIYEF